MDFSEYLQTELQELGQQQLHRALRGPEAGLCNFSTNDYLGLNHHPALREAARTAAAGRVGAGASRLVGGDSTVQRDLDDVLAQFKGTEAALSFSCGYATALGVIPALVGRGDLVILDKLSHACLIDGARLSGATLRIYPHNDLHYLEKLLRANPPNHKTLIVTESLFSMDGDGASLPEIVRLKEKHGAWLMVDEAHATGVFGLHRRGMVEQAKMEGRVEIQMGTLSKALGGAGGYIAGSRRLVDYLVNRARSLIYSTAPSPIISAVGLAAVRLVMSEEGAVRQRVLWERVQQFAGATGLPGTSPILPIIYGREDAALAAAESLRTHGFFAPAIRYPTVKRGRARVRITINAGHRPDEIDRLAKVLPPVQALSESR